MWLMEKLHLRQRIHLLEVLQAIDPLALIVLHICRSIQLELDNPNSVGEKSTNREDGSLPFYDLFLVL